MLQTASGIVLKRFPFRDSGVTVKLLLENGQSLMLSIHGILASRKRSNLITEPGTVITAVYYEHSHGQGSLKEATVVRDFAGFKGNYDSLLILSALLEIIDYATRGGENRGLYILLEGGLQELEEKSIAVKCSLLSTDLRKWLLAFIGFFKIRLLKAIGMVGDTTICSECGDKLGVEAGRNHPELNFSCHECSSHHTRQDGEIATLISQAARLKFARYLSLLNESKINGDVLKEIDSVATNALENFFDRQLLALTELKKHLGNK